MADDKKAKDIENKLAEITGNKMNFKVVTFNKSFEPPQTKVNKNANFVEWGKKNDYPSYMFNIFNYQGSATFKAIINKKVKLIAGQGFEKTEDERLNKFILSNKLNKEVVKMSFDYELFNGFCFEIQYNNDNTIHKLKHIPFSRIRKGVETEDYKDDYFWYSEDWTKYKKEEYSPVYIKEYDGTKTGTQLYHFQEYNPDPDSAYPIPAFSTTFDWIELDYEIGRFHLNQAKQGYTPSFILNFANGIPSEDEMDEFYKNFKRNFQGTENAGQAIITYSEGRENAPEIVPFQLNDSDKRFLMLIEEIEKNILLGSEIPIQLIMQTAGKLGSSDERKELLQEFQMSYISPRQNVLEESLEEVLGIDDKLILKKYAE